MAKNRIKKKSKRLTCHKRYKILKKVREHHRNVRKEAKKNLNNHKRKDPGVPNSLPFKDAILKHVEDIKSVDAEVRTFNLMNASKLAHEKEISEKPLSTALHRAIDQLIIECDVLLEILDARDPHGTRCLDTERKIMSENKRLVLVLNKIDLVPKSNLQLWLNYLRQSFTVMPFRANMQQQIKKTTRSKILWNIGDDLTSRKGDASGLGVDELMSLLANYSRDRGSNSRIGINVGVIGFPNTGKSALVNTLRRRKVVASSNIPGLTRQCQRIKLDKDIYLIDSPGIIVSKSKNAPDLVLKNCLKPESLPDPIPVIEAILSRCEKEKLTTKYDIDDYGDTTDFLSKLAYRLGKLKKGGVPNLIMAARAVINDWITGKITYFTQPPKFPPLADNEVMDTEIEEEPPAVE